VSLRLKSSVAMPIPPFSVGDGKITNAVSLSLARVVEVQMRDRSRMSRNEKIELVSD
jgi:hypothetical protein